ncbi:HAD family phosphatase [Algibacter aquimarinus]|uniref:HAD family phosphatase n=1 Tax=Algibacter aquimarinus TaxID=1136748 RepID=A0ABP9HID0_9FLAO
MIKTIIFDFGNVFINLNIEEAIKKTLESLNITEFTNEIITYNSLYEQGLVSTDQFLMFYKDNFPNISKEELIDLWNLILKDFPDYRLDFLKDLKASSKFKLILLSNTNELHINWIKKHVSFYENFKNCFDAFYLSHEINLRKPNADIFEFVLNKNNLKANECFFIDDNKDNIETAKKLNIKTWHINPESEDVAKMFKTKSHLF